MALITSSVEPKLRGSFMSINSSVQQLSAGLASFAAGFIVRESASGSLVHFSWVGFVACAITLLAVWVVRHLKQVG
jgi:predicted MFS family arabinose efflux permease